MVQVGSGAFRFDVAEPWLLNIEGPNYEVPGIAVNSKDEVHVFTRSPHPVLVFDRHGRFQRSFGEGIIRSGHGILIGPDDCVYLSDAADSTVRKFSPRASCCSRSVRRIPQRHGLSRFGPPDDHARQGPSTSRQTPPWHPTTSSSYRTGTATPASTGSARTAASSNRGGRAGHGSGPVQHPAQRVHRPPRHRVRVRSREQPRPAVHPERRVPWRVDRMCAGRTTSTSPPTTCGLRRGAGWPGGHRAGHGPGQLGQSAEPCDRA